MRKNLHISKKRYTFGGEICKICTQKMTIKKERSLT